MTLYKIKTVKSVFYDTDKTLAPGIIWHLGLSHIPVWTSQNRFSPEAHPIGGNRKRSKQSTDADQEQIETVFSIAICHHSGHE